MALNAPAQQFSNDDRAPQDGQRRFGGPEGRFGGGGRGFSRAGQVGAVDPARQLAMLMRMKDQLNLEEDQLDDLQGIADDAQKLSEEIQKLQEDLNQAVQDEANQREIRSIAGDLGEAMGDQAVLQVNLKGDLEDILNQDQMDKVEKMKQSFSGSDRPDRSMARTVADPEAAFKQADTDGNNSVSLEEFKKYLEQSSTRRFGRPGRSQDSDTGSENSENNSNNLRRRPRVEK